jgi:hypothetical protein
MPHATGVAMGPHIEEDIDKRDESHLLTIIDSKISSDASKEILREFVKKNYSAGVSGDETYKLAITKFDEETDLSGFKEIFGIMSESFYNDDYSIYKALLEKNFIDEINFASVINRITKFLHKVDDDRLRKVNKQLNDSHGESPNMVDGADKTDEAVKKLSEKKFLLFKLNNFDMLSDDDLYKLIAETLIMNNEQIDLSLKLNTTNRIIFLILYLIDSADERVSTLLEILEPYNRTDTAKNLHSFSRGVLDAVAVYNETYTQPIRENHKKAFVIAMSQKGAYLSARADAYATAYVERFDEAKTRDEMDDETAHIYAEMYLSMSPKGVDSDDADAYATDYVKQFVAAKYEYRMDDESAHIYAEMYLSMSPKAMEPAGRHAYATDYVKQFVTAKYRDKMDDENAHIYADIAVKAMVPDDAHAYATDYVKHFVTAKTRGKMDDKTAHIYADRAVKAMYHEGEKPADASASAHAYTTAFLDESLGGGMGGKNSRSGKKRQSTHKKTPSKKYRSHRNKHKKRTKKQKRSNIQRDTSPIMRLNRKNYTKKQRRVPRKKQTKKRKL